MSSAVMRRRALTGISAAALVSTMLVVPAGTAAGATCTYTRNDEGIPMWSAGCSTIVSPGKFGPLRMGRTTVAAAKSRNYLAYNRLCQRWDGVAAAGDWRSKRGTLAAWRGGRRTTKGLRPTDSLERARALYPSLRRTAFVANAYLPGEGWQVYSTRTGRGWLDMYRYTPSNPEHRRYSFFAVRAPSVPKPVSTWAQDGC